MIQNYINHIAFVIDASGSMSGLTHDVVKVFDGEINYLAKRSKELNQETRVSVYLFDTTIKCLIYDMDVMRLPSLKDHYSPGGGTALLDATNKAIVDLELTPQIYADHAFLLYVITDGEENSSRVTLKLGGKSLGPQAFLEAKMKSRPDNWTHACFVPNESGRGYAQRCGFPADNTQVWNTDKAGLVKAAASMRTATENFMQARAVGIRGTNNLFKLDAKNLTARQVSSNLDKLDSSAYQIFTVAREQQIRDFVENQGQTYTKGCAYYQLMKPVKVQNYKELCIQDKRNNKVYTGDNARQLLGLPTTEAKVAPGDHGNFDIFIQSTSVNRKLLKGQKLLVMT